MHRTTALTGNASFLIPRTRGCLSLLDPCASRGVRTQVRPHEMVGEAQEKSNGLREAADRGFGH
jgi:hypothetical protein